MRTLSSKVIRHRRMACPEGIEQQALVGMDAGSVNPRILKYPQKYLQI
jgi:hypothetical protein